MEIIDRMKDEKIDADTVGMMDDDTLKTFIPLLGDRIAVRSFCQKAGPSDPPPSSKKNKLLNTLRRKLQLKRRRETVTDTEDEEEFEGSGSSDNRSVKLKGNRNARKDIRKIDIGWIDYNYHTSSYKQVRKQHGGGTRPVSVSKTAGREDLVKLSKNLFFKGGSSSKGKLDDFEFEMCDFRKLPVSSDFTVGALYEEVKMPVLRFYLQTNKKSQEKSQAEESKAEEGAKTEDDTSAEENGCGGNKEQKNKEKQEENKTEAVALAEEDDQELPVLWWDIGNEVVVDVDSPELVGSQPDTPTVQFGPSGSNEVEHLNDTLPFQTTPVPDEEGGNCSASSGVFEVIILRRGFIIGDLIEAFSVPSIMGSKISVHMILPNGEVELGQGIGVFQDALTQFWLEFNEKMTTGATFKVPVLRHDFSEREWEAVGRIIAKGWKELRYFPIGLAPAFMETAIYGDSKADTKETFLQFIPESEREIIEAALDEFPSDDTGADELLDILGGYECRRLPTEDNLSRLLTELGHKECIQKPSFIAENMKKHLKPVFSQLSRKEFVSMYDDLKPDAKKVLAKLKFPEHATPQQGTVITFLKRYIRSLDNKLLAKFLRFCTASDITPQENITITFTSLDGFQRRPVGHTCGKVLEVPSTYESFLELKQEFNEIFNSGIWVMDIM